jgi:hypothetical protein
MRKQYGIYSRYYRIGYCLAQTNNARDTLTDLEAGGRTPEQVLAQRAKAVGINPAGMKSADLEKKVSALEALDSEE